MDGLGTQEALARLHQDIQNEINIVKREYSKRSFLSWLRESVSFKSELSKMRWPSVLFMTAQVIAHFIVGFVLKVDNMAIDWVGFQGFILILLLMLNLYVNLWDTKLRFFELLMKSEQLSDLVKRCSEDSILIRRWKQNNWSMTHERTLFAPKSPCVHQTLTYRDSSCSNLPDFLLVKGDVIHLYPGDRSPGHCVSLNDSSSSSKVSSDQQHERVVLFEGQTYMQQVKDEKPTLGVDQSNSNPHEDESIRTSTSTSTTTKYRKYLLRQFDHAKSRALYRGADFVMLSTPYIGSMKLSLRGSKRPVNSIEKECFVISRKYFETFVIPSVFILSTLMTAIHYGYLDFNDSDHRIKTITIAYLLLRPSLTIMPFLPWMFPLTWLLINAYGSARLICCAEAQRLSSSGTEHSDCGHDDNASDRPQATGLDNLLATPTTTGDNLGSEKQDDDDNINNLKVKVKFRNIMKLFILLVQGKGGHLWRSSSLLQVLGCLTSLCCIDKVGILSWPNPTTEKVFMMVENDSNQNTIGGFAMKPQEANHRKPLGDEDDERDEDNDKETDDLVENADDHRRNSIAVSSDTGLVVEAKNLGKHFNGNQHHQYLNNFKSEVLDVSQSSNFQRQLVLDREAFQRHGGLQFDDQNWRKYASNLKPLGLTVLLNNCCERSFGDYFRFYKHISYESILRCDQTPVVKRRCICELSKLIGFDTNSIQNYVYKNQIGVYKLMDSTIVKRAKIVSTLDTNPSRLKFPLPNMICNIQQDVTTGTLQLFSQGTADIVLDSCMDFWDGKQLVPLDESSRKKIMDFYQRTSLTSYCTAFAYAPTTSTGQHLADRCIELSYDYNQFGSSALRKVAYEFQEEILRNQIMAARVSSPRLQKDFVNRRKGLKWKSVDRTSSKHSRPLQRQENFSGMTNDDDEDVDEFYHDNDQLGQNPWNNFNNLIEQRRTRRHMSVGELGDSGFIPKLTDVKSSKTYQEGQAKLNDALDEISDQVFIGMVALQYQACPDFVALVEQLEHACIRFIHFSEENELRSRVFSEKMGLESGWNCHISLQTDEAIQQHETTLENKNMFIKKQQDNDDEVDPRLRNYDEFKRSQNVTKLLLGDKPDQQDGESCATFTSNDTSQFRYRSLPSLVMQLTAKLFAERQQQQRHKRHQTKNEDDERDHEATSMQGDSNQLAGHEGSVKGSVENSAENAGFESLAFDMSNRAKLPKGIEDIRPHLENIDNIPLQVSLFTDCNTELTKEMIEIMQDYGEIVCVLGSASSARNTQIFLQANASIAIDPLKPSTCCQAIAKHRKSSDQTSDLRPKHHTNRKQRKRKIKIGVKSTTSAKPDHESTKQVKQTAPQENNIRLPQHPRDRLGIKNPAEEQHPTQVVVSRPSNKEMHTSVSSSSSSSSSSSPSASTSPSSSPSRPAPASSASSESSSQSSASEESSDTGSESYCDSEIDEQQGNNDITMSQDYLNDGDQEVIDSLIGELPVPSSLASKLASLPCSYTYDRMDPVNLYSLIMEARHFTFKMKNTFVCMICFALSISSAQSLVSLLFLPPMFSSGLTIWLTVIVVPLMSFPLMKTTMDSQVMKIAVGKNLQLKPENITFFVICYLIKFIPSIIVVVLSYGLLIDHSCKLTGFGSSSVGPCWMFTYVQHANSSSSGEDHPGDEDLLWSAHLLTAQVSAAFLVVLYFVVISSGFVHRSHLIWQRSPTSNQFWVIISLVLLIGQLLVNFLILQLSLDSNSSKIPYEFLSSLPIHIWLISFMWPMVAIGINLIVKQAEIKAIIRQQRRARFDFNTKLGMNSPF